MCHADVCCRVIHFVFFSCVGLTISCYFSMCADVCCRARSWLVGSVVMCCVLTYWFFIVWMHADVCCRMWDDVAMVTIRDIATRSSEAHNDTILCKAEISCSLLGSLRLTAVNGLICVWLESTYRRRLLVSVVSRGRRVTYYILSLAPGIHGEKPYCAKILLCRVCWHFFSLIFRAIFGRKTFYAWPRIKRDYPLNLSISVSGGKETNKD